ncbi:MAG: agmatine deiminase family protein [Chitinophagales bacterium]|jgi:agmatine/peptidylarginine deiminase|nr:agmatine deiminase family protein [Sphingobacteriales bacterium]
MRILNSISLFCFFIILSVSCISQDKSEELNAAKAKAHYERLNKMSFDEYKAYFNSIHKRVPEDVAKRLKEIKERKKETSAPIQPLNERTLKPRGSTVLPADARFPGEFEEVKGIIISWPYSNMAGTQIDTIRSKPSADIWKNIARGVQEGGATIYINVYAGRDTGAILKYMEDKGYPLTNYQFLVRKGNAFWVRDYGPIPFYYDNDEKQGWVDYKYYPGRGLDDGMNAFWTTKIGNYPVYNSRLYYEGGNIIVDGTEKNQLLTSEMVVDANLDYFPTWTRKNVEDTLKNMFNSDNIHIKPYFEFEGGTGHIDLYLQRADDHTLVHTKYPSEMQSIPTRDGGDTTWLDYQISSDNINYFSQINTPTAGKKNIIKSIPLPKKDDGSWYSSGEDYNNFTRTFSNSLVVNNVIVLPIFHDENTGDKSWDDSALAQVQKHFPGYKIIPADMRVLDGSGGSIHCVTKEVPADNPVSINSHFPYAGLQDYKAKYPILAKIRNHSGVQEAKVYYRSKGATAWKSIKLKDTTDNFFKGDIFSNPKGKDTVEYYIEALSNNGKTMRKPISAPDGYFTFFTKVNTSYNSITQGSEVQFSVYPHPSQDFIKVSGQDILSEKINLKITDISGKTCLYKIISSPNELVDIKQLNAGIYFIELISHSGECKEMIKFVKN